MNMELLENTAAVLHGPMDLRMERSPLRDVGPNDVLLRMGHVGICGSDLKYWKYGVCGRFTVTSPMVLGHEGSGTVAKIGCAVKHLNIGDRVAIEPGIPCRKCHLCRRGKYNVCPKVKFCATPPVDGNLSRYFVHPADFCYRLPENVSLEEGALFEPLSVAVYSCERGNLDVGHYVFICGAGPVGLLTMMVAKVKGCTSVIISDIDDNRLQFAKNLGADYVINVKSMSPTNIASRIVNILGRRPDTSLECSGSDVSLNACIYATESGGSVIMVGRGSMEPATALVEAASREVDIKGVFRYANCYPKALSLVERQLVNITPLVSHRYSLEDANTAFETADDRNSGAIKVVINCEG